MIRTSLRWLERAAEQFEAWLVPAAHDDGVVEASLAAASR